MATALLDAFEKDTADGGVDEIYLVSTEFVSMLAKRPSVDPACCRCTGSTRKREGRRPGGRAAVVRVRAVHRRSSSTRCCPST